MSHASGNHQRTGTHYDDSGKELRLQFQLGAKIVSPLNHSSFYFVQIWSIFNPKHTHKAITRIRWSCLALVESQQTFISWATKRSMSPNFSTFPRIFHRHAKTRGGETIELGSVPSKPLSSCISNLLDTFHPDSDFSYPTTGGCIRLTDFT